MVMSISFFFPWNFKTHKTEIVSYYKGKIYICIEINLQLKECQRTHIYIELINEFVYMSV